MSVEELSAARDAVAASLFPWPANADGSYSLAALGSTLSMFQRAPADDAAAYRLATYWKAVAARALGDKSLSASAGASLASATASMASFATADRERILKDAAQAIRAEVVTFTGATPADLQRRGIALAASTMLDSLSSPTSLQRGTEEDQGWLATLRRQYDSALESIKKIVTGVAIVTGVLAAAVVAGLVWWFVSRRKR